MNETLISVIVPVYGSEPYLSACVESILNQTHTNLEVILVDDGSPDNCPALCDSIAERDSRVKVIHQENQGASAARNAGLDLAAGEFVAFCDSDDIVPLNAYETLLKTLRRKKADVVVGGFTFVTDGGYDARKVYWRDKNRKRSLLYPTICMVNKLYRRALFEDNGLRYEEFRVGEDMVLSTRIYTCAKRVAATNKTVYGYYIRSAERKETPSLASQRTAAALLSCINATRRAAEIALEAKDEQLLDYTADFFSTVRNRYFQAPPEMRSEYFTTMKEALRIFEGRRQEKIISYLFQVPFGEILAAPEEAFIWLLATRDSFREMEERCARGGVGMKYLLKCSIGWLTFKWNRLLKGQ